MGVYLNRETPKQLALVYFPSSPGSVEGLPNTRPYIIDYNCFGWTTTSLERRQISASALQEFWS